MEIINESQQRAIEFDKGAMLLIAGPGSGKTYVLTHRIKKLIEKGAIPNKILVITFTKAAACEMANRFINLSDGETGVIFGTFHSVFFNILKSNHRFKNVKPISDKEKIEYIKQAMNNCELDNLVKDNDELFFVLSAISSCKNNGNNPCNFYQERFDNDKFRRLFEEYNGLLREFEKVDFDDMVNLCLEVLQNSEDYLCYWQSKFDYYLIDEFQDISTNQYELIKLLAKENKNVFAVGDDDQSIYGFRGSRVELMKAFIDDFPQVRVERLSVNYRSSADIVSFANSIISDNKNRFDKCITSNRERFMPVEVNKCESEQFQNSLIVDVIKHKIEDGIMDIAILVRTNRQATAIANELKNVGIKTNLDDTKLFSSVFIKDICTYMLIAAGDYSRSNILKIINKPNRFIKREALYREMIKEREILSYYSDNVSMQIKVNEFFFHLNRLKNMSPYLSVHYIRNSVGYDKYVKKENSPKTYKEYIDEVQRFENFVKSCKSVSEVLDKLSDINKNISQRKSTIETSNLSDVVINISTFHASKGLEYECVILPDINEGIVPPKNALSIDSIEEERRMFYVAVTRAKNYLYIMYRTDENKVPSRFIKNATACKHNKI